MWVYQKECAMVVNIDNKIYIVCYILNKHINFNIILHEICN